MIFLLSLLLSLIIVSFSLVCCIVSFSLSIYFLLLWILRAYSPFSVEIIFISFGILDLFTWKTSTVLLSLINLLSKFLNIFSVVFSPVFFTFNLLLEFGFIFLKTSTFLVSTTNLLFFPGYIFSVISSPCFIKSLRNSEVGFIVDFDLASFIFPLLLKLLFEPNVIGMTLRFKPFPDFSNLS